MSSHHKSDLKSCQSASSLSGRLSTKSSHHSDKKKKSSRPTLQRTSSSLSGRFTIILPHQRGENSKWGSQSSLSSMQRTSSSMSGCPTKGPPHRKGFENSKWESQPEKTIIRQNSNESGRSSLLQMMKSLSIRNLSPVVNIDIYSCSYQEQTYTEPIQLDSDPDAKEFVQLFYEQGGIFQLADQIEAIVLKYDGSGVGEHYRSLVPNQLSYDEFWLRFFYRCTPIKETKKKMLSCI